VKWYEWEYQSGLTYMGEFHCPSSGKTRAVVAAEAGLPESTLSEVLLGRRRLNTRHIGILSRYFRLDPVANPARLKGVWSTTCMTVISRLLIVFARKYIK
jgi:hypothetical protein